MVFEEIFEKCFTHTMNFLRAWTTSHPSLCLQGPRTVPKIVSGTKQILDNVCRIYLAEKMAMTLSITKDFYHIWMGGREGHRCIRKWNRSNPIYKNSYGCHGNNQMKQLCLVLFHLHKYRKANIVLVNLPSEEVEA